MQIQIYKRELSSLDFSKYVGIVLKVLNKTPFILVLACYFNVRIWYFKQFFYITLVLNNLQLTDRGSVSRATRFLTLRRTSSRTLNSYFEFSTSGCNLCHKENETAWL
jgi:hypothetical protein